MSVFGADACRYRGLGTTGIVSESYQPRSPPMETLLALFIVAAPFVLIALVVDALRVADKRGGFPAISFTYRAYGA
jgi:hypothetical protein